MTIGERIKERRKEARLTQSEVAEKCGLSYQSVLNAEQDKSCTLETLTKICNALDLKIEIN
jgi:transcriptional regulator with XRE-family HTH domain